MKISEYRQISFPSNSDRFLVDNIPEGTRTISFPDLKRVITPRDYELLEILKAYRADRQTFGKENIGISVNIKLLPETVQIPAFIAEQICMDIGTTITQEFQDSAPIRGGIGVHPNCLRNTESSGQGGYGKFGYSKGFTTNLRSSIGLRKYIGAMFSNINVSSDPYGSSTSDLIYFDPQLYRPDEPEYNKLSVSGLLSYEDYFEYGSSDVIDVMKMENNSFDYELVIGLMNTELLGNEAYRDIDVVLPFVCKSNITVYFDSNSQVDLTNTSAKIYTAFDHDVHTVINYNSIDIINLDRILGFENIPDFDNLNSAEVSVTNGPKHVYTKDQLLEGFTYELSEATFVYNNEQDYSLMPEFISLTVKFIYN